MVKFFKKIYTILVLIKNLIFRKKHYILKFSAVTEGNVKRWYYDFKWWGFNKSNLEMVAGADYLCEMYSKGQDNLTIDVIASKKININAIDDRYDFYERIDKDNESNYFQRIIAGKTYQGVKLNKENKLVINTMWICPVTLFVLGRYPNCLYIKTHKNEKNG